MPKRLIVAMSGASGAYAAEVLLDKSPWPTVLIASRWAREVYAHECGPFEKLAAKAGQVIANDDLSAPPASGSVPMAGMVVIPCSVHTLASIAAGLGNTLITRAAHCQLKEKRPLVLCLRETPLTVIDLENAARVVSAGATLMPLSPPYYLFKGRPADKVALSELMAAFADRVLAQIGHPPAATWEDVR